jgi:hypothetical protein
MVKNSSKNNRRRVSCKVKVKPRLNKYKSKFSDPVVAKTWQHGKTTQQNLDLMGLVGNPNQEASLLLSRGSRILPITTAEYLDIVDGQAAAPAAGVISERNPSRPEHFMPADEIEYLKVRRRRQGEEMLHTLRRLPLRAQQEQLSFSPPLLTLSFSLCLLPLCSSPLPLPSL